MIYPEFKAKYGLHPDPQQEAAILSDAGATLLLAVPGSGKTTTLVTLRRAADMAASSVWSRPQARHPPQL